MTALIVNQCLRHTDVLPCGSVSQDSVMYWMFSSWFVPYLPLLSIGFSGRTFHRIDFVPDCSVPHLQPKGLALIVWGGGVCVGGCGMRGGGGGNCRNRMETIQKIEENVWYSAKWSFSVKKTSISMRSFNCPFCLPFFSFEKVSSLVPPPLIPPPPPPPSLLW